MPTELRNIQREIWRFRLRLVCAAFFVLVCFGGLFSRFFWLQVVRHSDLAAQAESNRIAVLPIVPNRGLIVDRNGVVLANNYSAYTLELTPSRIADLDDTIAEIGKIIRVTPRDIRRFRQRMGETKRFDSVPLRSRLSDEEVARLAAQQYRFPGVEIKARLFRNYPFGETASHLIGYIGRINDRDKDRIADSDQADNYRGTDYIGKLGIEAEYERELHGTTGVEEVENTAAGRPVRRLRSIPAVAGDVVKLTIDVRLQRLVEALYGNRRGAFMAIDPRNGQVLAYVSKPTFDPNAFVDGIDQETWTQLNESLDKPLLNRTLRGTYPIGSTYKPFMALAGLQTGKRTPEAITMDTGVYSFGGHTFRSPRGDATGPMNVTRAIINSSNVYFYSLAHDMGVQAIHDFMAPWGFGQITGIDLPGEVRGILPSPAWKEHTYKRPEQQRWYAGETISLGIGQGYNNFTVTQLGTAVAALAAGGIKHRPHLLLALQGDSASPKQENADETGTPLDVKPEYVNIVKNAMSLVTQQGTGRIAFAGAGYTSGGKTGTAQARTMGQNARYDPRALAEYQRDHSLYIAFAPVEAPRIAIAMIVENAGWGAQSAAPIARRAIDYELMGIYPSDEDIAAVRAGRGGPPSGGSRSTKSYDILPAGIQVLGPHGVVPEVPVVAPAETDPDLQPVATDPAVLSAGSTNPELTASEAVKPPAAPRRRPPVRPQPEGMPAPRSTSDPAPSGSGSAEGAQP